MAENTLRFIVVETNEVGPKKFPRSTFTKPQPASLFLKLKHKFEATINEETPPDEENTIWSSQLTKDYGVSITQLILVIPPGNPEEGVSKRLELSFKGKLDRLVKVWVSNDGSPANYRSVRTNIQEFSKSLNFKKLKMISAPMNKSMIHESKFFMRLSCETEDLEISNVSSSLVFCFTNWIKLKTITLGEDFYAKTLHLVIDSKVKDLSKTITILPSNFEVVVEKLRIEKAKDDSGNEHQWYEVSLEKPSASEVSPFPKPTEQQDDKNYKCCCTG